MVLVLLVMIGMISTVFIITSYADEKIPIFNELFISNTFSLSMENVYATGDCVEVLQKIKDEHWGNVNKPKYRDRGEMSWFAAGLVLGAHYVAKDCDTAESELDEILRNIQTADHEIGQSDIRDDISTAIRFIKTSLKVDKI